MREVKVFKMESQEISGIFRSVKVFDAVALFHQFAQEADGEGQSNPVAIIERADGKVETVYVHMMEFVDGPKAEAPIAAIIGTSLRDEFAGRAMQAYIQLAVPASDEEAIAVSACSFKIADAMLSRREP